jgi:hypothetical protein
MTTKLRVPNGHNGKHEPDNTQLQTPEDLEQKIRPCCARLPDGGWCTKPDGHKEPEHAGEPSRLGPEPPPAWEMQKRAMWADKVADLERAVKAGKISEADAAHEIRIAWLFVARSGVKR